MKIYKMKKNITEFLADVFLDIQPISVVDKNGTILDGYSYSRSQSLLEAVEEAHKYFNLTENQFLVVG